MVLGAFGSEVTVVPYVAWESAMTVCYFLWSFFLPTKFRQRVYNYCLMQRFQTLHNGRAVHIQQRCSFKSTGGVHEGTVSDTEVRDNSKVAPALLSKIVGHIVQLGMEVIRGAVSGRGENPLIARAFLMKHCRADWFLHAAFYERSTLMTT